MEDIAFEDLPIYECLSKTTEAEIVEYSIKKEEEEEQQEIKNGFAGVDKEEIIE